MTLPDNWKLLAKGIGIGVLLAVLFYWGRDIYYDHKFVHAMRTNDVRTLRQMGVPLSRTPATPPAEAGK